MNTIREIVDDFFRPGHSPTRKQRTREDLVADLEAHVAALLAKRQAAGWEATRKQLGALTGCRNEWLDIHVKPLWPTAPAERKPAVDPAYPYILALELIRDMGHDAPSGVSDADWYHAGMEAMVKCARDALAGVVFVKTAEAHPPKPDATAELRESVEAMTERCTALEQRAEKAEAELAEAKAAIGGMETELARVRGIVLETARESDGLQDEINRLTYRESAPSPLDELAAMMSRGDARRACRSVWGEQVMEVRAVNYLLASGDSFYELHIWICCESWKTMWRGTRADLIAWIEAHQPAPMPTLDDDIATMERDGWSNSTNAAWQRIKAAARKGGAE